MPTIRDQFNEFVKELGNNTDYIYSPQGNVSSKLLKEMVAEKIPFNYVNGYLLINSKNIEAFLFC